MKERQKVIRLVIAHCNECPHLKLKTSPYTGDSFDMIDEDAHCEKAGRDVARSCRPWELKNLTIPAWCPL